MALAESGLALFLIVASAQGLSTRYPVSSELRLDWPYAGWAVVKSALEIRQVGDNVHVQLTGPFQPARSKHTSGGVIPAADFRAFWDSLNQLGFWRMSDTYEAPWRDEGGTPGKVSISIKNPHKGDTLKTVTFFTPQWCEPDFKRVYYLIEDMARFAQPPKEEEVKVTLRRISPSEVMDIIHKFPEMVPSYLAYGRNDTELLTDVYSFSEVTAAPLEGVFPAARFYGYQGFTSPPYPLLMAVQGRKRYGIGGFNQLLVDNGLEVNDGCAVDLAKAFVIAAIGSERRSFPEITFVGATTVAGDDYTTRLNVLIGGQEEQWSFRGAYGLFMEASRRNANGYIKGYTFSDVEPPPWK